MPPILCPRRARAVVALNAISAGIRRRSATQPRWRSLLLGLLLLCLCGQPASAQDAPKVPRVLILYPYDNVQASSNQTGTAARRRLQELSGGHIDFYNEFLDLRNFPGRDYLDWMAENVVEKYDGRGIDLILSTSEETYFFAADYAERFAPGVPILFCCTPNEMVSAEHTDQPNVTGLLLDYDILRSLDLARALQPDLRRLYVVGGIGEIDLAMNEVYRQRLAQYRGDIEIEYLIGLPWAELGPKLGALGTDAALLLSLFLVDGDGKSHASSLEYARQITEASGAPAYAPFAPYLGQGLVGGYIGTFEDAGNELAALAWEILQGRDPATIPVVRSTAQRFRVDEAAILRYGLSPTAVPAGTLAINHTPSLWELYRGLVIAAVVVIVLQSGLILALMAQTARRRAAETNVRIAQSDLARVARMTTMGEMTASIAHEVNQPLAAIVANGNAALRWLGRAEPDIGEAKAALERIARDGLRAAEVITTVRGMFGDRSAERTTIDTADLAHGVLELTRGEIDGASVRLRTQTPQGSAMIEGDKVQLQQVILNLVTNAVDAMRQVSESNRVLSVTIETTPSTVELRVGDTGPGIPSDAQARIFDAFYTTKPKGMGMGLAICRSVVEAHGGELLVERTDQNGTVFLLRLPAMGGAYDV